MTTNSFLRREEYRRLARLSLEGKILDVGGAKASEYHALINGAHTITVANINPASGADLVFDAEQPWPLPDASYDAVLLVNLLEHLYHYDRAIEEAHRVLKPGGRVIGVVPFLFNVHPSPSDYFRFTRSALERMLRERGFARITVEELGTGAFSVVHHLIFGIVRWRWLSALLRQLLSALDALAGALKPGNLMSARTMPLGYYFEARTPTR